MQRAGLRQMVLGFLQDDEAQVALPYRDAKRGAENQVQRQRDGRGLHQVLQCEDDEAISPQAP